MRNRALPIAFILALLALIAVGVILGRNQASTTETPGAAPSGNAVPGGAGAPTGAIAATGGTGLSPSPGPSGSPAALRASNPNPDLSVETNGLSKATVLLTTSQGVIKFKFYPMDAPTTVRRIAELVGQGFYNGQVFHRVEPGFVIQTGDPSGTGMGGSGLKLKAEFNDRRHIEGTVAMARTSDRDSADSQFYVSLGTLPSLDHSYTVFGQVIEGMDVARKIRKGDRITAMIIE